MKLKTFTALIIAGLIVVFSIQNSEVIDITFFSWKLSISRVLLIVGSFSIGVLFGALISVKKGLYIKYDSKEKE